MHFVRLALLAAVLVVLAAAGARPILADDARPAPAPSEAPPASPPAGDAPAEAQPPAAETAAKDPRPLIRLTVRNDFKPEDKFFPQLVEGRLVADLADMETYRTAGRDARDADYALNVSIRNIAFNASSAYTTSKDADASSTPQSTDQALLSVDLALTLEDRQGKQVYEGKLTSSASHEIEKSNEYVSNLLKEEMIDRAAQRIDRLIRKKLKNASADSRRK